MSSAAGNFLQELKWEGEGPVYPHAAAGRPSDSPVVLNDEEECGYNRAGL